MEFKKIAYFVVIKKTNVFITADGKWTTNFSKAKAFDTRKDAIIFISNFNLRKAIISEVQDWWILENNQLVRSGQALIKYKNHV